jgi:GntR family carbon starvation induced transcriptional regulator
MSTLARPDPAEVPETDTLSERAANLVERDIIAGVLAPGARLGIVDLVQRYEIGATPLREGLSRLVSRGLIVGIGQRGFRVADVSREDLLDITRMRTVVEIEALRLATINGDDAWEAGILGTLHQMRRHIERTGNDFREGAPDFDRLHKAFHTSLLAACGSRRLLSAHSELYDQAYRYRRVMMRGFESGKKFVAAHQDLADQVLARDVGKAQAMLEAHLRSTLDFVYPPAKGNSKKDGS